MRAAIGPEARAWERSPDGGAGVFSLLRAGRGASLNPLAGAGASTPLGAAKPPHRIPVEKLLIFFGLTVGGWLGWAAGEPFGMFAAFVLSIVGTALGLLVGRKIARDFF